VVPDLGGLVAGGIIIPGGKPAKRGPARKEPLSQFAIYAVKGLLSGLSEERGGGCSSTWGTPSSPVERASDLATLGYEEGLRERGGENWQGGTAVVKKKRKSKVERNWEEGGLQKLNRVGEGLSGSSLVPSRRC